MATLRQGSRGDSVKELQRKLNTMLNPSPNLPITGFFGSQTHAAVLKYQSMKKMTQVDGIVGRMTQQSLGLKISESNGGIVNTKLPASGTGYTTYNRARDGADQFGTEQTINAIIQLGVEWSTINSALFQVGDISFYGGGAFPGHSSHKRGIDVDIRPFRKDRATSPITISDSAYDSATTISFIRLIRQKYPNVKILFNDSTAVQAKLTNYYKGHHNHMHVSFK